MGTIDLEFRHVVVKLTQVIKFLGVMATSTGLIIGRIVKLTFVRTLVTFNTVPFTLMAEFRASLSSMTLAADTLPLIDPYVDTYGNQRRTVLFLTETCKPACLRANDSRYIERVCDCQLGRSGSSYCD